MSELQNYSTGNVQNKSPAHKHTNSPAHRRQKASTIPEDIYPASLVPVLPVNNLPQKSPACKLPFDSPATLPLNSPTKRAPISNQNLAQTSNLTQNFTTTDLLARNLSQNLSQNTAQVSNQNPGLITTHYSTQIGAQNLTHFQPYNIPPGQAIFHPQKILPTTAKSYPVQKNAGNTPVTAGRGLNTGEPNPDNSVFQPSITELQPHSNQLITLSPGQAPGKPPNSPIKSIKTGSPHSVINSPGVVINYSVIKQGAVITGPVTAGPTVITGKSKSGPASAGFHRRIRSAVMELTPIPVNTSEDSQTFGDSGTSPSINSPADSGIVSCSNTSIYAPLSASQSKLTPALMSGNNIQMSQIYGSTSTDLTSNASGSPTPSPEEGAPEMPKPIMLPSETPSHLANSQTNPSSAFKPYLPKNLLPSKGAEASQRSSSDSDPRVSATSSNQSSGPSSLRDSLRNSMASSESSNYSIVSEQSGFSNSGVSDNSKTYLTKQNDDQLLIASTLTPTFRPRNPINTDSGKPSRPSSLPSEASSTTSSGVSSVATEDPAQIRHHPPVRPKTRMDNTSSRRGRNHKKALSSGGSYQSGASGGGETDSPGGDDVERSATLTQETDAFSNAGAGDGCCVLCDQGCSELNLHPWRRKCAACGCPSSGHMTHPSHVNKVISYLFNDNTPQQTTSSSSTTTNTNSDTQGLVASVTSVVPNSHGVLPGVAGSIPGGVGSIPGGVGSGVGSTGGGNKLSISSLSDTDSGCYVMDEYAWVPPGLNPKQVQCYFSTLPPYKVPYVNSVGEQHRQCQLVTQLPPHDILPRAGAPRDEQSSVTFAEFSYERKTRALGKGIAKQIPLNEQYTLPCDKCKVPLHPGDIAIHALKAGSSKLWHPACFVCHICQEQLVDLIYFFHSKDEQLYCGRHHAEMLRPRCSGCDEIIFSGEYTQCGNPGQNWHVNHFCCSECEVTLTGGKYVMQGSHPYCPSCYDSLFAYTCALCQEVIGAEDTQVTYQDQHWHANKEGCFNCHNCGKNLVGLPFIPKTGIIFCSQSCKKGETVNSSPPLADQRKNPSPVSFRNLKSNFPPLVPPIVKPTFTGLSNPGSNHSSNHSSPSSSNKNKTRSSTNSRNLGTSTPPKSLSQSVTDSVKLSMHLNSDGSALIKDEDYDSALSSCHSSTLDSPQNGTLVSLDRPPPLPPKPSFMRGGVHLERIQEQHYVDKFSENLESVMELPNDLDDEEANVYFEQAVSITPETDHVYAEPKRQQNSAQPPRSMPDLSKSGRTKSILKDEPASKPSTTETTETLSNSAKNVSFNPEIAERARSNSLTRSDDSRADINSGAFSDSEDFNFSKMRGAKELKHRKDLLKAVARSFTKDELEEYLGHRAARNRLRGRRVDDGFRQRIDCYDSDSSSSSSDDETEDYYWAPTSHSGTHQSRRGQNIYYNHTPTRSAIYGNGQQRKKRSGASKKNSCKIS
ncbi:uncharacterized protein LOC142350280 isoform X2 [Convolutriloba macropyga]